MTEGKWTARRTTRDKFINTNLGAETAMAAPLVFGLAVTIAVFGVIANHAREMYKDRKYREMFGTLFWAVVPIAIFGLFWVANENPSTMARNIILGIIGAVLGGCALIWVGCRISGADVDAQKPSQPPAVRDENTNNQTGNVTNQQGIISQGQTGGTNTININPPTKNAGKPSAKDELLFSPKAGGAIAKVQIGQSQVFITGPTGQYGAFVIAALQASQFMIELIEGKIRFSAQITDEEGNIIAKISRNEWQVAPPPRTWDKNYSDDALEVVDPKGRVVLQAKVLSDRIQIQGAWPAGPQWGPAGVAQIIVRADPSGSGAQFVMYPKNPPPGVEWPTIQPIFVYPSDLHLGELRSR